MRWSLARRITFRFLFAYFALFFLSDLGHGLIPVGERAFRAWHELWLPVVLWVDEHVLRLGYAIDLKAPGVNNTAYGWILCLCYLALSAVIAGVWSVLDRKRPDYERLHAWFRLELRFLLGRDRRPPRAAVHRSGPVALGARPEARHDEGRDHDRKNPSL